MLGTSNARSHSDASSDESLSANFGLGTMTTEDPWSDEDAPTWPQPAHAKRVLVAEDDAAMRDLLLLVLRERGYAVDCVSSGSQMMSVLSACQPDGSLAEPFDLIVTDVRMPGASGLDAIDQLRRAGGVTPVIAVTAFPHEATLDRAQRLEIRLLAKPFDLDTLRAAVEAALESRLAQHHGEHRP
jgi:two-component system response regulator AtoC